MFDNLKQKINPEMSKKDIHEIIKSEKNEFMSETKELINKIKNGEPKDNLYKVIQDDVDNKNFIEIIDDFISPSLIPFEETKYLREIDLEKFKYIINNIFENTFIQVEQIKVIHDEIKLEKDQIKYACKFLNTLVDWLIIRRYSLNCFKNEAYNLFRLDSDRAVFIYSKLKERKDELTNIVMLNNVAICKEIKNEIKKLVDIFSEIFEEDEEDLDE